MCCTQLWMFLMESKAHDLCSKYNQSGHTPSGACCMLLDLDDGITCPPHHTMNKFPPSFGSLLSLWRPLTSSTGSQVITTHPINDSTLINASHHCIPLTWTCVLRSPDFHQHCPQKLHWDLSLERRRQACTPQSFPGHITWSNTCKTPCRFFLFLQLFSYGETCFENITLSTFV